MKTEDALNLQCPQCSTRLRMSPAILDSSWFRCPECSIALVIAESDGKFAARLVASLAEPSDARITSPLKKSVISQPANSEPRHRALAVAGVVLIAIAALLVIFWNDSENERRTAGSSQSVDTGTALPEVEIRDDTIQNDDHSRPPESIDADSRVPDSGATVGAGAGSTTGSIVILSPQDVVSPLTVPQLPIVGPPIIGPPVVDPPVVASVDGLLTENQAAENSQERFATAIERLNVTIASFTQSTPAAGSDVIDIVEQMAGVEVQIPEDFADVVARKITLKLRETSPLGILKAICEQLGLQVQIDGDSIRLSQVPPE